MSQHIRHGQGSVRPYMHGPFSLIDFIKKVFHADEVERHTFDDQSCHVQFQIGDSALVLEAGKLPKNAAPWPNQIYVYVDDVDTVYQRARELGAQSIAEPEDKPYDERQAGIRDIAGNTWWIATYTGSMVASKHG